MKALDSFTYGFFRDKLRISLAFLHATMFLYIVQFILVNFHAMFIVQRREKDVKAIRFG